MRGILGVSFTLPQPGRISLAHAGNTPRVQLVGLSGADQPRTCGEYATTGSSTRARYGSAPHMRGIRTRARTREGLLRISPAHAGNTTLSSGALLGQKDQPRTCGEYERERERERWGGSAPHMRGIRGRGVQLPQPGWISPAHAGNTRPCPGLSICHRDQPRTCGEYSVPLAPLVKRHGSAPHMRGIRGYPRSRLSGWRISPAHAGNTPLAPPPQPFYTDQPRTCGEYVMLHSGISAG